MWYDHLKELTLLITAFHPKHDRIIMGLYWHPLSQHSLLKRKLKNNCGPLQLLVADTLASTRT